MTDADNSAHEAIQESIRGCISQVAAARERACEAAVQSGQYGVLETHHRDGTITFDVTDQVPYGEIHVRDVGLSD